MITQVLRDYLLAQEAVTAALGDRVYPGIAPNLTSYPLVQFFVIAGRRLPVLDGPHLVKQQRVQIDVYAQQSTVAQAGYTDAAAHAVTVEAIAAVIETAMEDFRGVHGTTDVRQCVLEAERGGAIEDSGNLARWSQDYDIWWRDNP